MKIQNWLSENASSLSGKTVAISGSTGGLGQELCRHLASLGATLIMLDRNTERSLCLSKKLKSEFPELKTQHIRLDLEDILSVIEVTNKLLASPPDYLILNAGAYHIPRKLCALGYNNVFQINYVSPYYMAKTLLPKIKEKGGRIVAVGSIAHAYSKIDVSDIDFSSRTKSSLVYGNAKRHLMYSLSALGESTVAIAHPGITLTNITAHYPKLIFAIIKHPMKVIFMKPKVACLSIVKAMFLPSTKGSWWGPRIFDVWGKPEEKTLKRISEEEYSDIRLTADTVYQKMKDFK